MARQARSLVDLHTIVEDLVGRGVSVRFLREGQTYSAKAAPIAKLMLGLLSSVAELERSVIDTQRWWDIDEAAAQIDGDIYPAQILEYARAWREGWDGHMIRLTDTREP